MTDDAWQTNMREAMGEAMAAFMRYSNAMYRDSVVENERLRERVKYLETRVAELTAKPTQTEEQP